MCSTTNDYVLFRVLPSWDCRKTIKILYNRYNNSLRREKGFVGQGATVYRIMYCIPSDDNTAARNGNDYYYEKRVGDGTRKKWWRDEEEAPQRTDGRLGKSDKFCCPAWRERVIFIRSLSASINCSRGPTATDDDDDDDLVDFQTASVAVFEDAVGW